MKLYSGPDITEPSYMINKNKFYKSVEMERCDELFDKHKNNKTRLNEILGIN